MNNEELGKELESNRKSLLGVRCRMALGEDVKSSELKNTKRDIARILTVMNEGDRE
jgi:ribosomal protein L29